MSFARKWPRTRQVRPRLLSLALLVVATISLVQLLSGWSIVDAFSCQSLLHRNPVITEYTSSLQGRSGVAVSSPQIQRVKTHLVPLSAKSDTLETPADGGYVTTVTGLLGKAIIHFLGICVGLIGLLYVTNFFELLLESSTGSLQGKSMAAAGLTGLLVGTLHTLAGPDHFAGLAPLVIGQRRTPVAAFGLGALWGSGHATGQLLLGLACLGVQIGILRFSSVPAFDQLSGFLVGASLIGIGLLGLYEAREFDQSELGTEDDSSSPKPRFGWATYAEGVLHGLSPDAIAFMAPVFALPRLAALFNVLGVVVGTLLTMGMCTALLSAVCQGQPNLRRISGITSAVAMSLGACILASSFGLSIPLPGL